MQRNLTNMDHNNDSQYLMDNAAPVAWTNRDPSPVGMGRYDSGDTGYSPLNKQQTYGYGNGGGYRGF
jgi:hypothetical protein